MGFVAYLGCSGSPIIKKETRGKDEKWKLIGVYTGNSTVILSTKDTLQAFCNKQKEDKKVLLNNIDATKLFDLINEYSGTLIT